VTAPAVWDQSTAVTGIDDRGRIVGAYQNPNAGAAPSTPGGGPPMHMSIRALGSPSGAAN
jgi:hypothetical protein